MKNFILPEELGTKILNYLGKQPYIEVAPMISSIMQLTPIEEPPAPAEPPKK